MKIVVIGGTGLIGSKTVTRLRARGHDVIAASPNSGVNAVTGEGLAEALAGTQVVIDLANSPSFEDQAVLEFFETAGRKLLDAESVAGVNHHVALSVVGTEKLQRSGYFRAKLAQERLIRNSPIPYTIIHSTQFFEFIGAIANSSTTQGSRIMVSPAMVQPIASDDVADRVASVALGSARHGIYEIAGPDRYRLCDIVEKQLAAKGDNREIVPDTKALYFGAELEQDSLLPGSEARLGSITFDQWLSRN